MPRFYVENIAETLTLNEEESHHCVKVLRLAEGDAISVVDGKGKLYECHIDRAHSKHCHVAIDSVREEPTSWHHRIVLGVSPTKNLDRMEWLTEKCTEMGIDEIVPLLCHNSERKVLKTERLNKIAVAGMKQSKKSVLPKIHEMTAVKDVLNGNFAGNRFIAYCDMMLPRELRHSFVKDYKPGVDTLVLVGPEGDFSPAEVELALKNGFVPVSLGESRLRTETAGVYACAVCHTLDELAGCGSETK